MLLKGHFPRCGECPFSVVMVKAKTENIKEVQVWCQLESYAKRTQKNANCSKLKKFVFRCGTMIRKLTGNGQRNYND